MSIIKRMCELFNAKSNSLESLLSFYRSKGIVIGDRTYIHPTSRIDSKYGPMIEIGSDVSLSANVIILVHDASTKRYFGYTKIGKVHIGNMSFIGAGSIVLPGTYIGDNCIIGAGSVVRGNIPDNSVLIGNPAQIICNTDSYISKNKEKFDESLIYDDSNMDDLIRASKELTGTGFVI